MANQVNSENDDEDSRDDDKDEDVPDLDFDDAGSDTDYDEDKNKPRKGAVPAYKDEEDPGDLSGMARILFDAWVHRKQVLDHPCAMTS